MSEEQTTVAVSPMRSWFNHNRTPVFIISVLVVLALLSFAFGIWRYGWGWTGFLSYTTPKSDTEEFQPGKTLWDWLELLIIPAVLAGGAFFLNRAQRQNELDIAEKQREQDRQIAKEEREAERQIAKDREEERAVQSYLEAMTRLLPEESLRTSDEGSEVRSIARSRTLTVLRSLNSERKGSIVRFLYEAKLIDVEKSIVNLKDADLSEADLSDANLNFAALSEANLSEADLSGASLNGAFLGFAFLGFADLYEANLRGASLNGAFLGYADLSGATYNDDTIWPVDFDPEAAGVIKV